MSRDDRLFWGLFIIFAADWLFNQWHIRMLKNHIRQLETG